MSLKTHILLYRAGKDQFGEYTNEGFRPPLYAPSPEQQQRDAALVALHKELNSRFFEQHSAAWLRLFTELSKKAVWQALFPFARPSLGTFYQRAREFHDFQEFLGFILVANKAAALLRLGLTDTDTKVVLAPFAECGRYFVPFGASPRTFSTSVEPSSIFHL